MGFSVHILSVPKPIRLFDPKDDIPAGSYLLEDQNAGQLLVFAESGVMQPHPQEIPHLTAPVGSDVLFMRAGGFGDLMFLTPVLRAHKAQFPNAKIAVCCFPPYAAVLEGLPYVDEVLPYPLPLEVAEQWPRWVLLEGAIERDERAKTMHMTDLFAEFAGIEIPKDQRAIDYRVTQNESIATLDRFPNTRPRRRVGIQVKASARARTYPIGGVAYMAQKLIKHDFTVYLLGQRGDVPPQSKHIEHLHDLSAQGLTFRQSASFINTCDVVIAPDSALLHVAGALGVPAVGLYGPFPRHLRVKYAPSIWAFEGRGDCAPCFHHPNQARQDHFPRDCPSRASGVCAVLASIEADRVVAKAVQISNE